MSKRIFICLMAVLLLAGCNNRIKILKRAKEYYRKDDYPNAIEQFERLIETYADRDDTGAIGLAEAHYFIGEIYLEKQNEPDSAVEKFLLALEYYPDYPDALLKLGGVYHERRQLDEAEEYLILAVKVSPLQTKARSLLTKVLWVQAMQMRDELEEVMKQGKSEEAGAIQKKLLEKIHNTIQHQLVLINIDLTSKNFLELAESYKEIENWDMAVKAYGEALRRGANRLLEPRFNFMEAMTNVGMLDLALEMAKRTIEDFPAEAEPYIIRGRIQAMLGENDKALEEFNIALTWADAAEAFDIKYELARVGMAMEHYDTAIAITAEIAKDHPTEEKTRALLAEIYAHQEKWGLAMEALDKYREINPLDIVAQVQKGYLIAMQDGTEQGIEFLNKLGDEHPNFWFVPLMMARVYAKNQDLEQAFESLNSAVDNGWTNYSALYNEKPFKEVVQDERFIQLVQKIAEKNRQNRARSLMPREKPPAEEKPTEEEKVVEEEKPALSEET